MREVDVGVFAGFVMVLFVLIAAFACIRIFKKKFNMGADFFAFSFFVLLGTVLVIILQFYLLGTPFLNARGANFLYVLFIIPFVFLMNIIYSKNMKGKYLFIIPFMLFDVYRFINSINFYNSREWWFDGDTKHVMSYLESKHPEEEITLNTACVYNTSFQFHIEEDPNSNIIMSFNTELRPCSRQ